MNIFKRLLKIGQAEIHALVEKMEDPILLTEESIADLKSQQRETTEQYTRARALAIRTENEIKSKEQEGFDYENKAKLLLEKAQNKEIEITQAESLAYEALKLKKQALDKKETLKQELREFNSKTQEIRDNLEILDYNISKWEKELTTLIAKKKINTATRFANEQLANMDKNSTIDLLEKIKEKTSTDDALNEAYQELVQDRIRKDIEYTLNKPQNEIKNELEELKKQFKL